TRIGASADGGTTWSVARLLGQRRALEWLMLGNPMHAGVALAAGLINRVVPADSLSAEVDALARRIPAGLAFAYAEVKRLVYQAPAASFDLQLEAERDSFVAAAGKADFREGIVAFFERRPAKFGSRNAAQRQRDSRHGVTKQRFAQLRRLVTSGGKP